MTYSITDAHILIPLALIIAQLVIWIVIIAYTLRDPFKTGNKKDKSR